MALLLPNLHLQSIFTVEGVAIKKSEVFIKVNLLTITFDNQPKFLNGMLGSVPNIRLLKNKTMFHPNSHVGTLHYLYPICL